MGSLRRRGSILRKVLAIYEPRFIFTAVLGVGLRALGRPVSKLLSLEEEPPSLAQAELPLVRKLPSDLQRPRRTGPARACRSRAFRRQPCEQRISQTSLPRRQNRRVERLALAEPQPHPQPRAARAHRRRDRRGARGDPPARRPAADRRDAVLHEPDRSGQRVAGLAPHDDPDARRVRPHARRGARSARRGRPQPRAGPRPSLSRPRTAARHELLLGLLPLLHARPARRRERRASAAQGRHRPRHRVHRRDAGRPGLPDLGRRPAVARRGPPRVRAVALAGDSASRVHPHRQQAARRSADARDAGADEDAAPLPSDLDEPALHASRRGDARGRRSVRAAGRRRHSRSAARPCC